MRAGYELGWLLHVYGASPATPWGHFLLLYVCVLLNINWICFDHFFFFFFFCLCFYYLWMGKRGWLVSVIWLHCIARVVMYCVIKPTKQRDCSAGVAMMSWHLPSNSFLTPTGLGNASCRLRSEIHHSYARRLHHVWCLSTGLFDLSLTYAFLTSSLSVKVLFMCRVWYLFYIYMNIYEYIYTGILYISLSLSLTGILCVVFNASL